MSSHKERSLLRSHTMFPQRRDSTAPFRRDSKRHDSTSSVTQLPFSRSSNVKVVGRFRPLVDFEIVLPGVQEIISFIDEKTVGIPYGKEMETFKLDRIFDPNSHQSEVYEFIGRPTIEDVLDGYNGTIFAYGQTGSGKTYTMMGYDFYDEEFRGIIPRAASQIFEFVRQDNGEIEYTLKCSMLEIYKETIKDLLDNVTKSLSIKECPRRGIYVQGLNQVCVTSEKGLLDLLALGETMRTVASTKLNKTSSRSHMMFVLEVLQKLPNDSEKRGILNLVDLAGSEKVNHSGVTGNNMEEAKKINLSLSALGNVIHALVLNNDHIPYRDSKLTRILQESLGGNYKTNLIVACSPSNKYIEETINTMKFAIRAKSIKNNVKINIKNSPENYIKLIEQLRAELTNAKSEILLLKEERLLTEPGSSLSSSISNSPLPRLSFPGSGSSSLSSTMKRFQNDLKIFTCLGDPIEELEGGNNSIYEVDSLASSYGSSLDRSGLEYELESVSYCQHRDNMQEDLERAIDRLQKKSQSLEEENQILTETVRNLEAKLASSKEKRLKLEQQSHEYYENYHRTALLINKESSENRLLKRQNESLNRQIKRLTKSLNEIDSKFKAFVESQTKTIDLTCVEFDERSEMTGQEFPVITEVDEVSVDPCCDATNTFELDLTTRSITIEPHSLINTSAYAKELQKALESNAELSKDITVFQLRNQVIEAGIFNANMTRCMQGLNWKLNLVNYKYEIKRNLCRFQSEEIKSLESMLDHLHESYQHMIKLYEQIDKKPKRRNSSDSTGQNKGHLIKSFTSKKSQEKSKGQDTEFKQEPSVKSSDSHSIVGVHGSWVDPPSVETSEFYMRYKALETNFHLQQMYNFQLKKGNEELRKQTKLYQEMIEKLENDIFSAQKAERERWQAFFYDLKENCEKELIRKQLEVIKLNEVLGEWATRYMELQESIGIKGINKAEIQLKTLQELKLSTLATDMSENSQLNSLFLNSPLSIRSKIESPIKRAVSPGDRTPPNCF
ncbi:unnamed protein product [Blepharisma stoltei]|uniref:Kinesin motor domain-containing protein n=1 Tax=Blepharisma stoltei TaxID=1481888 RepID=A0AAU9JN18_9CILI|nr:unnamed protein product [Blepharisma stoltei]